MGGLLDLPNELLSRIVEYATDEMRFGSWVVKYGEPSQSRPEDFYFVGYEDALEAYFKQVGELNVLCRVCKRIQEITQEILHYHPWTDSHWHREKTNWCNTTKSALSLVRRPDLAKIVRSLNFLMDSSDFLGNPMSIISAQEVEEAVAALRKRQLYTDEWRDLLAKSDELAWVGLILVLAENVQKITIRKDAEDLDLLGALFPAAADKVLTSTRFTRLQEVTLNDVQLQQPLAMLLLPTLQSLWVSKALLLPTLPTSLETVRPSNLRTSKCTFSPSILTPGFDTAFTWDLNFYNFISNCPKLEHLDMCIDALNTTDYCCAGGYSFAHVVEKLAQVASTLETLNTVVRVCWFQDDYKDVYVGPIDTMLHFQRLKNLSIPQVGLAWSRGLSQVLPSSLECLNIFHPDLDFARISNLYDGLVGEEKKFPRLIKLFLSYCLLFHNNLIVVDLCNFAT